MATVSQEIEKAQRVAAQQGSSVLLLVTLGTGERLVMWVDADGAAKMVEGR